MAHTKIKILMVLANTRMGGVQAFILNILRNIDLEKFHIDFAINFYAENNGIEDECRTFGCNFYILPYFKVYNYWQYYNAWDKFLSKHDYDIVYAHATNSASIFLKIAKKYGMRTIAHSHSAGFRGNKLEQITKKIFAKGVGNVADYWFACSDKAAERLYGDAYKSYKHYFDIPNAIDSDKYLFNCDIRNRIREQIGISEDCFLCGHVGTFSQPKNHIFLIDIFSAVLKEKPNAKLICCGTGALLPLVKEHAKEVGILDKIIFAGVINNVNEYMMAMDCFVFPSLFEGFPVSILEAQAAGLPIVMSDVITKDVDITELVHRMNLKQDASEWAAKVVTQSIVHERLQYNQAITQTKYNIKYTVKEFEKLYMQIINE